MTINPHTTIAIGPDGKPWTRADITRIRRSQAWRNLSTHTITTQPVCYLGLPGCTRISTCSDHVIPAMLAPWLMLEPTNVRGACFACNNFKRHRPLNQLTHLGRGPRPRQPAALAAVFGPTTPPPAIAQGHPRRRPSRRAPSHSKPSRDARVP